MRGRNNANGPMEPFTKTLLVSAPTGAAAAYAAEGPMKSTKPHKSHFMGPLA